MKNDLELKKKLVLDLIKLKKDNYGGNIRIFWEDIKQCGLEQNIFYDILFELEKKGFITDLEITDLDGGIDTGNGWAPWFAVNEALFPGLYVFKTSKKFNNLYYNAFIDPREKKKTSLKRGKIVFNDDSVVISMGNKKCQLPPFKNEHFFCKILFQYPVGEFVDWSIIFKGMDKIYNIGKEGAIKDKRSIQDTLYRINNRIREVFNTNDNLFTWEERSVKRNY